MTRPGRHRQSCPADRMSQTCDTGGFLPRAGHCTLGKDSTGARVRRRSDFGGSLFRTKHCPRAVPGLG
jgi:hypothetical protein